MTEHHYEPTTDRRWGRTGAGFGPGFWQVHGVGDERHDVYGTVEKVAGGFFAVSAAGDTRMFDRVRDGAQWLADVRLKECPEHRCEHLWPCKTS